MKTKSKPKRKPGAPKGNKNALRHGFYARSFSAEQNSRLDGQASTDVQAEINLLRICIDKLNNQIDFQEIKHIDMQGNLSRNDHYLNQLNTLAAMTQSLATLVRTHYLTHGKSGDIQSSILAALEELRLEMGL